MVVDAGLLAAMRAAQEDLLPDTCTIQSATAGQDAIGQPTRTWANRAIGVACRLGQRSERERWAGERPAAVGDWVLTVAHDQVIERSDRVIVGSRTFEVVGVNTGTSWETATRVDLVEVV
jgi:head-tail adaptor